MLDYYKELEILSTASSSEIRKTYHQLSRKYHPDKNPDKSETSQKISSDKFKRISEAYAVLSDVRKRTAYDNGHYDPKYPNDLTKFNVRPWEIVTLNALCGAFLTVECVKMVRQCKSDGFIFRSLLAGLGAGFGSLLGAGLLPDSVATPVSLCCGVCLGFGSVRKIVSSRF